MIPRKYFNLIDKANSEWQDLWYACFRTYHRVWREARSKRHVAKGLISEELR